MTQICLFALKMFANWRREAETLKVLSSPFSHFTANETSQAVGDKSFLDDLRQFLDEAACSLCFV